MGAGGDPSDEPSGLMLSNSHLRLYFNVAYDTPEINFRIALGADGNRYFALRGGAGK